MASPIVPVPPAPPVMPQRQPPVAPHRKFNSGTADVAPPAYNGFHAPRPPTGVGPSPLGPTGGFVPPGNGPQVPMTPKMPPVIDQTSQAQAAAMAQRRGLQQMGTAPAPVGGY